jgi:RNA polymerase sigma factor (sigma-70 family)
MVFMTLARKASALARHPALVAWLYSTTLLCARKSLQSDQRRLARETRAATDPALAAETSVSADSSVTDWTRVEPVLDEALATLAERDRQAVLLRYFSGQAYADIGQKLGVAENTARMRTDRALEKLRRALAKRGVTSTASALGLALGANAVTAAPASVAASTLAALGATSVATTTATAAGTGLAFFTTMTTATKLTLGVATVLVFASLGWWGHAVVHPAASSPRPALVDPHSGATKQPPPASSPESAAQLQARLTALKNRLADTEYELTKLRQNAAGRSALVEAMIWDRYRKNNRPEAASRSLFPDVAAAGLYLADANLRLLALSRDFPELPTVGTPAYDDFQKRLEPALKSLAVVLQDELLITEIASNDPARISRVQAAYIAPALALRSDQTAIVTEIIRQASAELISNSATLTGPDTDTRKAAAKQSLNDQAVARIKSLLTPEQQTLYARLGYNDLLFRFHYTLE